MQEKVTNVLVSGANGRLGQLIASLVQEHPNWRVCCGFDKEDCTSPLGFPIFGYVNQIQGQVVPKPDIIIDFSRPEATLKMYHLALELSIPMVIGTTGLDAEIRYNMKTQCKIAIFQAYNMAQQIKLFTNQVCETAKVLTLLDDYDIDVEEVHHDKKVDEVSGTAFNIANAINATLSSKYSVIKRPYGARGDKEIHIIPARRGTCPGTHRVIFASREIGGDTFVFEHIANSPIIFAKGAIKAAEFVLNQTPGLYNMNNM